MNAIEENQYTHAWESLSKKLTKPNAILSISVHQLTEGTFVHAAKNPKTMHDFWGFPDELYAIQYRCPGAPKIAKVVQSLIKKTKVGTDSEWASLDKALASFQTAGARYPEEAMKFIDRTE